MGKRLRWSVVLFFIITVMFLASSSYGQTPAPAKSSNEPKSYSKNSSKKNQAIQPNSQNSSPSQTLQITPETKQEATHTTNKQDNQASGDWWIRLFTGVLAFVALLQLVTFCIQTHWMHKTLNATKATAEAVKIQAQTMRDELALKHRSKIHVRDVAIPGFEDPFGKGQFLEGRLSLVNLGGMPANIVNIGAWFEIGYEKGFPTEMPDESEKANIPNPQPAKLEVGQSFTYEFSDKRRPMERSYESIRMGVAGYTLYVIGYVKYTDTTGLPRYSRIFHEYRLPKGRIGGHKEERRFFPVEGYQYEE